MLVCHGNFTDTGNKATLPEAPFFQQPRLHTRFCPFIQCANHEAPACCQGLFGMSSDVMA